MISGPDQQRVLQALIDRQAVMIQGNNERAIVKIADGTAPDYLYTAKQFALRRWAYHHLDEAQVAFIRSLPEQRVFELPGAAPIHMAHGSPRDINELVFPRYYDATLGLILKVIPPRSSNQIDEVLALVTEPVLVLGHAHLPWYEQRDGRFAMNPGAVNVPLNGWVGAQYALLDWDGSHWTPELRAIRYDMDAFKRANESSGFLSASILARIFMEEVLQGRDVSSGFFLRARKLSQEAGLGHLPYIPDEIWEQVEREYRLPD